MILGAGCSVGSEAIAGTAHHWNLITVSMEYLCRSAFFKYTLDIISALYILILAITQCNTEIRIMLLYL